MPILLVEFGFVRLAREDDLEVILVTFVKELNF